MVSVLGSKSKRLRYELQFWICRLSSGWLIRRELFYSLFETSLRLHNYRRATQVMRIATRRCPGTADVQSMQCTLAFRAGDLDQGFALMALRLQATDYRAVERLLFRTGSRPQDQHDRLKVLAQLSELPSLLQSHRCYALIAQSYLVLKLGERDMAASLLVVLRPLILDLAADPDVYGCQEPNRRNRAKLLISLCTCSYHLALLVDDEATLIWLWSQVMEVASKLRYAQLNPDACLRMSSNLSRCLAVGTLISSNQVPDAFERTQAVLKRVELEVCTNCVTSSGEGVSKTQENHLALMTQLQRAASMLTSREALERAAGIRRLSQLLNHSSARDLNGRIASQLEEVDHSVG
jgi:hypothetical protein